MAYYFHILFYTIIYVILLYYRISFPASKVLAQFWYWPTPPSVVTFNSSELFQLPWPTTASPLSSVKMNVENSTPIINSIAASVKLDENFHLYLNDLELGNATTVYELLQPLLASFLSRNHLLPMPSSLAAGGGPQTTTPFKAKAIDLYNNIPTNSSTFGTFYGDENRNVSSTFTSSSVYESRRLHLRTRLTNMMSSRPSTLPQNDEIDLTAKSASVDHTNNDADSILANVERLREQFAMSMPQRVVFQTLYASIFVVALIGNCLVIIVYRVARQWRQDISVFHVNLAIADILLAAFCVPFTAQQVLDHFWPWPRFLCPVVLFLQPLSVFVSVYTLVAIGIDRLKFVQQPLQPGIFSGAYGKMVMLAIWCISSVLAGVQLVFYQVKTYPVSRSPLNETSGQDPANSLCECKLAFGNYEYWHLFGNFVLSYFIPLSILIGIYAHIGRLVWASEPPGQRMSHSAREELMLSQKKRIIVSLVIIVALFVCAWLPLHVFVAIFKFLPEEFFNWNNTSTTSAPDRDAEFAHRLGNVRQVYLPCHVIAMTSTCINPFVYAFLHPSFRTDCRRVLSRTQRWFGLHTRLGRQLSAEASNNLPDLLKFNNNNLHRRRHTLQLTPSGNSITNTMHVVENVRSRSCRRPSSPAVQQSLIGSEGAMPRNTIKLMRATQLLSNGKTITNSVVDEKSATQMTLLKKSMHEKSVKPTAIRIIADRSSSTQTTTSLKCKSSTLSNI